MPARPLVSIVTSNFNHGKYLEDTILSILRQDYAPLELIIVDGASKDNSLEIIKKYADDPRVRWLSEPDAGHMYAVNKGVALARGEILGVQHSTDIYQPGAVCGAVEEFRANPKLSFVGGHVQTIDIHGYVLDDPAQPHFDRSEITVEEVARFINFPGIQGSFFRRDFLVAIGGFSHSCHTNTYLRYFLETARLGGQSLRVPTIWGNYRSHPNDDDKRYLYKGLAYADQRRKACRENEQRFRGSLPLAQVQMLSRAGDEYELRFRILQRHQTIRAFPAIARYCALGGSLGFVITLLLELGRKAIARLTGQVNRHSMKQGPSTRWFVDADSATSFSSKAG